MIRQLMVCKNCKTPIGYLQIPNGIKGDLGNTLNTVCYNGEISPILCVDCNEELMNKLLDEILCGGE